MWALIWAMGLLTSAASDQINAATEVYDVEESFSTEFAFNFVNKTCPKSKFLCNGTNICLDRIFFCDNVKHCPNGEDEKKELCIDMGSFQSVFTIATNMTFLGKEPEHFRNCSLANETNLSDLHCHCRFIHRPDQETRKMFLCENNTNVKELPIAKIPPFFNHVVFGDSDIEEVHPGSLASQKHWLILSLIGNRLKVIRKGAFHGLSKLKTLILDRNQIHTVETGAFETMETLNWLSLDINNLSHFNSQVLKDTPILKFLFLDRNRISFERGEKFHTPKNLSWLFLGQNRIKWLEASLFDETASSLVFLNLSYNLIEEIHEQAFMHLRNLEELSLDHNRITYLKPKTFYSLKRLQKLNVGFNLFTTLPLDIFSRLSSLVSLHLVDIEFVNINTKHFDKLRIAQFLYFKKFRYCSYAPQVLVCHPRMDGLSSTEHLLVWPVLRLSVWVVALVTIISNVVVFAWRILSRKEDRVLSLFVKNLSVADFLMGIYLLAVAIQDVIYRGVYNQYAMSWMTSWRCMVCGVIAMLSCEVSVLILSLITFERYRCIRTNVRVVTERAARFALLAVWMTGLLLALLPLFQMDGLKSFYANNGLCFPLHIHDPFMVGWQYSAFVFLGVNFCAMVLIISLYLWMFIKIKRDRRRARPVLLKQREDAVLARRFFFIVLTDCLCWIPIIIIKILALGGTPINDNLYAFVVVFILPVNSALNPVIYTLAAPTELRRRIRQMVPGKWFCKTRHSFASTDSKTANSSLATQSSSLSEGRSNSNGTCVIPAMPIVPASTILESSNEESDVGDETKL